MQGSTDVLFVVYIRTSHLTKHSFNFQEFITMSKLTHTKKVIEFQHVFISEFKVIPEVNDGMQTRISYIKYELQNSIEDIILGKRNRERLFWLHVDVLKELFTMNPMEKHLKIYIYQKI